MAISTWSLYRKIPNVTPLIEFPPICQEEFGVEAIELNSPFFKSTRPEYLLQLREVISERKIKVVNIAVDLLSIASPDNIQRTKDIQTLKKWFSIGKSVGSPSIRANTGWEERVNEMMIQRIMEGYKELVKEAERTQMKLLLKNHGGPSAGPDNSVRIIGAVGSDRFSTCPDFGNFAPEIRYEGLAKISKYAFLTHVKTYNFTKASEETPIDIKRCIDILGEAEFDGYLSVEYEGKGERVLSEKEAKN